MKLQQEEPYGLSAVTCTYIPSSQLPDAFIAILVILSTKNRSQLWFSPEWLHIISVIIFVKIVIQ